MGSVSPKEDEVFFATDFLIGIITQSSGGISFRLFFICGVPVRIFEIIVFAGSQDGFGIQDEGIHRDDSLLDEGFVNLMMDFL